MITKRFVLLLILVSCFSAMTHYGNNQLNKYEHISEDLKIKSIQLVNKEGLVVDGPQYSGTSKEDDVFKLLEKPAKELTEIYGEPNRKDLSLYGYTWWVYTDQENQHIQFGIKDNRIQTIYATGNVFLNDRIELGDQYDVISDKFLFVNEIPYKDKSSFYTFILNDKDMIDRPLIKISDETFIQLYFDTVTNKLSSVRLLTGDVLLRHASYEIEYRGTLPEKLDMSQDEWTKVEEGMEQQIFEITNVVRNQHKKSKLNWNDGVRQVAYMHSKDMAENNYFSHYSLDGSGLKERLAVEDLHYKAAGENIAAQYSDAPAAIEGWLNSEGHRKALLSEEYTHLGVGVYRHYYTQNFLNQPF